MTVRLAAIQMVSGTDLDENLRRAELLIAKAASQGANLVVLPETFAVFSAAQQLELGHAECGGKGLLQIFLAEQARKYAVYLVGGTIPIAPSKDSDRAYTASLLFNDKGEEIARYNKVHLFDVDVADGFGRYRESDTFIAGDEVVVVDTPMGRLGLAVCYDIRFPELFRAMFAKGVDIIAVPAAFTKKTGEAHWLALLKARAIENQCYVIGANQGGQHGTRETSGGSVIIDGWGNVLADVDKGEACIVAEMDLDALSAIRKAMPIKQHQRF